MTGMILYYAGAFAIAIGFYVFIKWAAAVVGGAQGKTAAAAFDALPGFKRSDMLIYIGSAIAFDGQRVAIWEKASGARLVQRNEVGAWHSGTLLTVVLNRTTATPMIQLYRRAGDDKPFFKVGVLKKKDCKRWSEHLSTAFGADKEFETAVRVLGVD